MGAVLANGVLHARDLNTANQFHREFFCCLYNLHTHVDALTGIIPSRNADNPASLIRAMSYIQGQFTRYNRSVFLQPFNVEGKNYYNVIASFGPPSQYRMIIGAHYDVYGDQPGADDNASGIAVLLELGRLLADETLDRTVDLVAFCLEEPPYFRTPSMGSAIHARSLIKAGIVVEIMVSIDMVGYFNQKPPTRGLLARWVTHTLKNRINTTSVIDTERQHGLGLRIATLLAAGSSLDAVTLTPPEGTPGMDFSDHLNYWRLGIPAVLVTNFPVSGNPHYHCPTDTLERLDFSRMVEMVRGIFWMIVRSSDLRSATGK